MLQVRISCIIPPERHMIEDRGFKRCMIEIEKTWRRKTGYGSTHKTLKDLAYYILRGPSRHQGGSAPPVARLIQLGWSWKRILHRTEIVAGSAFANDSLINPVSNQGRPTHPRRETRIEKRYPRAISGNICVTGVGKRFKSAKLCKKPERLPFQSTGGRTSHPDIVNGAPTGTCEGKGVCEARMWALQPLRQ